MIPFFPFLSVTATLPPPTPKYFSPPVGAFFAGSAGGAAGAAACAGACAAAGAAGLTLGPVALRSVLPFCMYKYALPSLVSFALSSTNPCALRLRRASAVRWAALCGFLLPFSRKASSARASGPMILATAAGDSAAAGSGVATGSGAAGSSLAATSSPFRHSRPWLSMPVKPGSSALAASAGLGSSSCGSPKSEGPTSWAFPPRTSPGRSACLVPPVPWSS